MIIKRGQRGKDQNKRKHATSRNCLTLFLIVACEHALRESLAAGREKEEELATTSLEFECQLNATGMEWLGEGKALFSPFKVGKTSETSFRAKCLN